MIKIIERNQWAIDVIKKEIPDCEVTTQLFNYDTRLCVDIKVGNHMFGLVLESLDVYGGEEVPLILNGIDTGDTIMINQEYRVTGLTTKNLPMASLIKTIKLHASKAREGGQ